MKHLVVEPSKWAKCRHRYNPSHGGENLYGARTFAPCSLGGKCLCEEEDKRRAEMEKDPIDILYEAFY